MAAGGHFGPWSEEDLAALSDEARGCEPPEGTLLVNPPPAGPHQAVSRKLTNALEAAAGPG